MSLSIYFGVPGCGKSTHAASVVYHNLKKGWPTYCNFPVKGAFLFDDEDIGKFSFTDCDMIIDEASISYNNRNFKKGLMTQDRIAWFKLHRHYGVRNIYVYSQSYDDMDITLRRLADRLYLIKRTLIPWLSIIKHIRIRIGINDETHQIEDQYSFDILPRLLWLPCWWHMFDSFAAPELPQQDYTVTGFGANIDKSPGNRQLRGLAKLIRAGRRRNQIAKLRRLKDRIFPPPPPEPPDPWLQAVLDKTQQEREEV